MLVFFQIWTSNKWKIVGTWKKFNRYWYLWVNFHIIKVRNCLSKTVHKNSIFCIHIWHSARKKVRITEKNLCRSSHIHNLWLHLVWNLFSTTNSPGAFLFTLLINTMTFCETHYDTQWTQLTQLGFSIHLYKYSVSPGAASLATRLWANSHQLRCSLKYKETGYFCSHT